MGQSSISITISRDQAIVLCELFNRSDANGQLKNECVAEYLSLQAVAGQLDKELNEPFSAKYESLLMVARSRVEGGYEGGIPWAQE